ncbi:hypothetical protein VPHG_00054 [Vibrio phage 11895-B1]|uniref:hypothetical protein n=1 Tax=Vibrio phage 11895-B1 TaxID=754075 RepID=UPI0002C04B22|nr:hypothetical protein VPHG_00054 [Vibrio phage 11895-B1]AGH32121.1 hypothetical protein VPHG_00054 [Vibrio phage 11895-B1]
MIDINLLSKKERRELCFNVEEWFPSYSKPKMFTAQFKKLKEEINLPNTDKECWAFICCITKAIRYGNNRSYMAFDSGIYNYANKQTKKPLNAAKMTAVANRLEELGYLTRYLGFKFDEDSSCSIVQFNDMFLNMFDEYMCQKFGMARDLCVIEMFDTSFVKGSNGKEKKTKTPIDIKGKHGLGKIKFSLTAFNKLIHASKIRVEGVLRTDLLYKRVFECSFEMAGRWYVIGDFQSLSKQEREKITINGRKVCCVDYWSTHPNVLRTLLGVKESTGKDPYSIELSVTCDKKELRELCKVGLMCILFNKSAGKAKQALTSKLTKDKYTSYKDGKGTWRKKVKPVAEQSYPSINTYPRIASEIIDKLIELNDDISKMFFTEKLWAILQGYDAQMAQYVIDHFTKRGIVTLPWHDAFIIDSDYEEDLRQVMLDAWEHVVGNTVHCRAVTEFSKKNFKRFNNIWEK